MGAALVVGVGIQKELTSVTVFLDMKEMDSHVKVWYNNYTDRWRLPVL